MNEEKMAEGDTKLETYPCYVKVAGKEDKSLEMVELPTDMEGKMLMATIKAQFPSAIGLRYKSEKGAWRGLLVEHGNLCPPLEGWGSKVYFITFDKEALKRKAEESAEPEIKLFKGGDKEVPSDLIAMGLVPMVTTLHLREYFSKYGPLANVEVKCDPVTRESRGFGFLTFKSKVSERKALDEPQHFIIGNPVELTLTKKTVAEKCAKIFLGRLPQDITELDLKDHFKEFGPIHDVYIPKPFKGFGFVTFESADDANEALQKVHNLKGNCLNVAIAPAKSESERRKDKLARVAGRQQNFNQMGGYGGPMGNFPPPPFFPKNDGPMKLFVGRLKQGTTEREMKEYFEKFGEVEATYIPLPFKAYGFVDFKDKESAVECVQQSHMLKGNNLNVAVATKKQKPARADINAPPPPGGQYQSGILGEAGSYNMMYNRHNNRQNDNNMYAGQQNFRQPPLGGPPPHHGFQSMGGKASFAQDNFNNSMGNEQW